MALVTSRYNWQRDELSVGQTEIARLLMPEGILWEEDSSFSGTIEDSDSVTKFNSDSGLVWKEYRH